MRLHATAWLVCLLAVACTPQPQEQVSITAPPRELPDADIESDGGAGDDATPARFDGYGPLRFGLDAAALRLAWKDPLQGAPEPVQGCRYLLPVAPDGVRFMLEDDRLVRYDIARAGEIAPGGGRVDMDVAALRAHYGAALQEQPHGQVGDARVLRVADTVHGTALVFEIGADGRVQHWRVGVPPQVDDVEGCGRARASA